MGAVTTTAVTTTVGNYGNYGKERKKKEKKRRKEGNKRRWQLRVRIFSRGCGRRAATAAISDIGYYTHHFTARQSPTVNQAQGEKRWEWESFGAFVFYHLRGFLQDR